MSPMGASVQGLRPPLAVGGRAAALALVIAVSPCPARPPELASAPERRFLYENWQQEDGLPQASVNAIAEDHDGYLWLGTEEGLVRFDGLELTVFNRRNTPELRSHAVRALLADRRGRLWIATRSGLALFEDGRFARPAPADGLAEAELQALYEDAEGFLWIGTRTGLYRFDGESVQRWTRADGLAHDAVWAIGEEPLGVLWIGTELGLQRFANGRFDTAAQPDLLAGLQVRALRRDRRGGLWIGTRDGLYLLADERLTSFSTADGLTHPTVNALFVDRRGDLWVGTEAGTQRLRGGVLSEVDAGRILERRQVLAFWEDREGGFWIGMGAIGLVYLRPSRFVVLGTEEGLADEIVWTILQGRTGDVWIGTNNGLTRLAADGSTTNYTTADGLPGPDVRALAEDHRGDLWIGTETSGLARLAGGALETFSVADGLADQQVNVVVEDGAGDLWIGTEEGLSRLSRSAWTTFSVRDGLPHRSVKTLEADPEGGLWIGTAAGLARYEDGRFTARRLTEDRSEPFVKALHRDRQGTLWIGTADEGLFRYRDGELSRYTVEDGLFDSLVHEILEDGAGNLWMTSNQGVFRVAKRALEDFAAGREPAVTSVSYSESDGMRSRECNGRGRPAGWRTRDGRLWFPTIRGVAIIDPADLDTNEVPPAVHLEQVLVDRRPVTAAAERPVIAPGAREFEFHYVGLSYVQPEKVRYRYKLEPFNADWIDAGARRSAHYTNLEPGAYTFRVIAKNNDGVWNRTGASFAFRLRPALHQTWYFYAVLAAAIALAVRAGHRLRVRGLVERNAELLRLKSELEAKNAEIEASHAEAEAKAAELERFTYTVSHDLKSPLFTVEGFLAMLEKDLKAGRQDRVAEDLSQIRDATGKMGELLQDLLELSRVGRLVEPREAVPLGDLFREARSLVAGKIAERGVEVTVGDGLPVVIGDRRRLLQVCQNLIENAVKYMGDEAAPRIEVAAQRRDGEVLCSVADNGMGLDPRFQQTIFGLFHKLDPASEGTGIGLALVQRIVEVHGGCVWVESPGPGKGSTFYFTLPSSPASPS